jgi:hypothetical protein
LKALRELGYERPDHVVIEYSVESGKFAGTKLRHGFIVPVDFPINPPGGIHIAASIHPAQSGGQHPTGGIHRDEAFQQALGGAWQYWSRSPADWATCKKTVVAYLGHVWRLRDSQ